MASRFPPRCCPCMKNGRCIRCQCVKNGRRCVDCRPSSTIPARCVNFSNVSAPPPTTHLPASPIARASDPNHCSTHLAHSASPVPPSQTRSIDAHDDDILQLKRILIQPCRTLKRIPRGSRALAAMKLASAIDQVILHNDIPSWVHLLQFPKKYFRVPRRGGKRWNLTTLVNKQISEDCSSVEMSRQHDKVRRATAKPNSFIKWLSGRVSSKLEEGNFKGAVRLACSEDTLADHSEATLNALRLKHPSPHPDSHIVHHDSINPLPFPLDIETIMKAIVSFPNSSGGGFDGLLPQHLKDLSSQSAGEGGQLLRGKKKKKKITIIIIIVYYCDVPYKD